MNAGRNDREREHFYKRDASVFAKDMHAYEMSVCIHYKSQHYGYGGGHNKSADEHAVPVFRFLGNKLGGGGLETIAAQCKTDGHERDNQLVETEAGCPHDVI